MKIETTKEEEKKMKTMDGEKKQELEIAAAKQKHALFPWGRRIG